KTTSHLTAFTPGAAGTYQSVRLRLGGRGGADAGVVPVGREPGMGVSEFRLRGRTDAARSGDEVCGGGFGGIGGMDVSDYAAGRWEHGDDAQRDDADGRQRQRGEEMELSDDAERGRVVAGGAGGG